MREPESRPAPGQAAVAMLGLTIGLLLVGLQLWLLTLAFDLYQSGERRDTVGVAILSGLVFLGGLAMLRLLSRRPPGRRR
jgi:cytochrome c biogenesis protein CcdA